MGITKRGNCNVCNGEIWPSAVVRPRRLVGGWAHRVLSSRSCLHPLTLVAMASRIICLDSSVATRSSHAQPPSPATSSRSRLSWKKKLVAARAASPRTRPPQDLALSA